MSKYQDPKFDKEFYRKRREKDLPGQTGYVRAHTVVVDEKGKEQRIPINYKGQPRGLMSLRARSRQKSVDRKFTKKMLNAPFSGHKVNTPNIPRPFHPGMTNHVRMLMRKDARQKAYEARKALEAEAKATA